MKKIKYEEKKETIKKIKIVLGYDFWDIKDKTTLPSLCLHFFCLETTINSFLFIV